MQVLKICFFLKDIRFVGLTYRVRKMLLEVLELSEEVCMQIVKLLKSVFLDLDD